MGNKSEWGSEGTHGTGVSYAELRAVLEELHVLCAGPSVGLEVEGEGSPEETHFEDGCS